MVIIVRPETKCKDSTTATAVGWKGRKSISIRMILRLDGVQLADLHIESHDVGYVQHWKDVGATRQLQRRKIRWKWLRTRDTAHCTSTRLRIS